MKLTFCLLKHPLWQSKGRIVVSLDGNEHDHDKWGGTPLSLAIIAANGLQDKLSVHIYSDHICGSNHEHTHLQGVTPYAPFDILPRALARGWKYPFEWVLTQKDTDLG